MAIKKTQAFVLRTHDLRETSLIAHFFSKEFGKVSGVLKGVRADPKKFASTLEPFSLNEIIFYEKRNSELHLVSQCDLINNFSQARSDIFKVGVASIMMELLSSVTAQEDSQPQVFDLVLACLKELENHPDADKILMIFKIKLLALSGFKPHFDSCVSCNNKLLGNSKFSLGMGGMICEKCFHKDQSGRSIFRGTVASILHIEKNELKINLNLGMNPQIKRELNFVLGTFLKFHLGKDFKSERILDSLKTFSYSAK